MVNNGGFWTGTAPVAGANAIPSKVIPALRHLQHTIPHPVDQPVLAVDPARPPAAELAFQRLRLAGALEWRPLVFEKSVNGPARPLTLRA
jgi:hypothetical protein